MSSAYCQRLHPFNPSRLLLTRKNDVDGAIKVAETAVRVQPKYWPLLDTLGYAYYIKGDNKKAVTTLEQAVKLMKVQMKTRRRVAPDVLLHAGMALIKDGQTELGKKRVAEAMKYNPNLQMPESVREIMQRKP